MLCLSKKKGADAVKKRKGVFAAVLCLVLLAAARFCLRHPTHLAYDDFFILGSSMEAIEARYGSFDELRRNEAGELVKAVYQIRGNTPELVMSYDDSLWYEIRFEDGIAVEVALREGYIGG